MPDIKTQAATPSDDYTELEQLALAATRGTWTKRTHPRLPSFIQAPRALPTDPYDIELLGEDDTLYSTREADIDFITAAQPQRVLLLIRELRNLQASQLRILHAALM